MILTSDHGEMLGERGLWYKMSFFEGASRVPLVVARPGRFAPRRVGGERFARRHPADARRSSPAATPARSDRRSTGAASRRISPGGQGHDEAIGEYLAEGAIAPIVMIRRGGAQVHPLAGRSRPAL